MNRHMQRKHDATTKMRRLYLREPSALIPIVTKNISLKANTLSIFQKNITLMSKLLKKTLQICKNFFHGKKKKKVKTFYILVNSVVLAVVKLRVTCIMFCQHDGHSKAHRRKEEPERKTNKRYHHGRIKRGTFCPARMKVKLHENDSAVSVTYIRAHNHPIGIGNTAQQPTSTSVLNSIKTKLSLGVPVNNIYRELREGIGNRNSRETSSEVISKRHLLKKSNVSDIHRHMNYGRRLHPNDSTSTYLLVKKLQEEDFNAVLLYIPQGDKVVIGPKIYNELDVGKKLFAIGLQTKQQLDMFIKQRNKIVCIDSTHET